MTIAKIALSWVNHVDRNAAILTASDEAGDLAVANLANPTVGRRWRTVSTTGWVQVDFGADVTVGVLALRFPRDTDFPTAGTVRHRLDPDGGVAGTGAAYDSAAAAIGTAAGYGYHVHMPPTAVTARYWRFDFNVSGVTFIDVGRAWAGAAWRPTYNIALGYEDGWADLSRVSGSERSGAEFVDSRARQRAFAFALEALSDAERDDLREMQRLVGIGGQLLLVKDPDSPATTTVLGRLAATTPLVHRNLPIHAKAFALRESL
jgi:hypothetical protein